jgi:putative SOS response-associated peptidase YedK
MYVRLKSGAPMGFAGLYDTWQSPAGEAVTSCTIITTSANALMQPIHDRMPAILSKEAQRAWLDATNQDIKQLVALLKPYPADEMQVYPVSPLVNSPRNNSTECIKPI